MVGVMTHITSKARSWKEDSFCLTLWGVLSLEVATIPREVQSSLCEETLRRGLGQQTALGTRHMDKVASGCSYLAFKASGWGPRMVKHSPCSYCDLSELLTHGFWVCNRWLLDEPQWLPSCSLGVASSGGGYTASPHSALFPDLTQLYPITGQGRFIH